MTQELLQDALVDDLRDLFSHSRRENSLGLNRAVQVFAYDVPIREGDDEGLDPAAAPEPYILVRTMGGSIQETSAPLMVEIVLVICVYDRDPNRQGYRDTLHILNELSLHFATNGIVGRRYSLQYPLKWSSPDEDTHPYYFAAMSLHFEAPPLYKEVPNL